MILRPSLRAVWLLALSTPSAQAQLLPFDRCNSEGFSDQLSELEIAGGEAYAKAEALLDECQTDDCRTTVEAELANIGTQLDKLAVEQTRCEQLKEAAKQ